MVETITSRFIIECWKKGEYPDGFDDMLEHYLDLKRKSFMDIRIKDLEQWMNPVVLSIAVGLKRDYPRFRPIQEFWQVFLSRRWDTDLENKKVVWRK
jgi:hypothetical protein